MPLNIHSLNRAVTFAAQVHHNQKRKGKDVPYITHPLAVALLIARTGADDPIITAGVLHDTIEDCEPYGSITKEYIAQLFGEAVATIVSDLSEEEKTLPWMERKLAALKHIPRMSHDSLLVKSADVLHNLVCLLADIESQGTKVFKKFNASQEDTISRYVKLVEILKTTWSGNPLLAEIEENVHKLQKVSKS